MSRNRTSGLQPTLATACLLTGCGIYLLFRHRNHLGFLLLDQLGLTRAVDTIRHLTDGVDVPDFVRYCLPDGLWSTSYVLISDYVNRNEPMARRMAWASVVPALGCTSELMQWAGLLPGSFDLWDLACYALPLLIYFILNTFSSWTNH